MRGGGAAAVLPERDITDIVMHFYGPVAATKTGRTRAETISVVMVHHDTNLYDLKIKAGTRTSLIHTTSNHPFWDAYLHYWVSANKLSKGEHLKTPDDAIVTVVGGTTPADHDGWMWDLTVPGNDDHDFYVLPAYYIDGHHLYYVTAVPRS